MINPTSKQSCCLFPFQKGRGPFLKITLVVLGILSSVVGILAFAKVPGFSSLHPFGGGGFLAFGSTVLLLSLMLQRKVSAGNGRKEEISTPPLSVSRPRPTLNRASTFLTDKLFEGKFGQLTIDEVNQLLPKERGKDLRNLPEKHLKNPGLQLDLVQDEKLVELFSAHYGDRLVSIEIFNRLSFAHVNLLLPRLKKNQLALFFQSNHVSHPDLNLALIGKERLDEVLLEVEEGLSHLSVSAVNRILPFLSLQVLEAFPLPFFAMEEFAIETFSECQLETLFAVTSQKKQEVARRRFEVLSTQKLNGILYKLKGSSLRLIGEKHLSSPLLNWSAIAKLELQQMFPQTTDREKSDSYKRFALIPKEKKTLVAQLYNGK